MILHGVGPVTGEQHVDANGDRLDLPWQIRNGLVVSGVFETARERLLADEVNASHFRACERNRLTDYRRGREDGRALYEPRSSFLRWLVLMFDGGAPRSSPRGGTV